MGRSVSYASGSIAIAYQVLQSFDEDDNEIDLQESAFEMVVEDIQNYAPSLWKSFDVCDKWLDREDHAILQNRYAYIGISEYCGLVSIWLKPKDDEPLAENFCNQIKDKFLKSFGTLRKVGTFSNGEAVFEKVA